MKHILLALAAALSLTAAASAAGTQLEVHTPQGPVKAGETYQVTAELTGNPGFHSLQFALTFDVDAVECTRVQAGPLIQDALWAGNRSTVLGAAFAAAASETVEGVGTVAVFSFLAKDDLPAVSVGVAELLFYDRDGAEFPCDTTSVSTADLTVGESGTAASPGEKNLPAAPPPHRSEEELAALEEEMAALEEERRQNALSSSGGVADADKPSAMSGAGQSTASGGSTTGASTGSAAPSTGGSTADENADSTSDKNTGSSGQNPSVGGSTVVGNDGSADDAAPPVFTDTAGTWAEAEIAEAARRDLFHGYADGSFRPNNPVTRGQYVLVLWNLAGRPAPIPEPGKTLPFRDLEGLSNEFRNAIAWAWENGYVNGTTPNLFSPGDRLTRQAAM
ncbi:MAG: S-layer homology domain-containing protein, partial [Oscillibacter sp.]|nr:S-layer homology domain-containing protein [Oscillibacter sp.]